MGSLIPVGLHLGKSHFLNSPFPSERHFHFTYRAFLPEIPEEAEAIRFWLPLASSRDGQKVLRREITASNPYQIHREPSFGNEVLYSEFKKGEDGAKPVLSPFEVTVNYEVLVKGEKFSDKAAPLAEKDKFLKPSRLMTVTEEVQKRAKEVTAGKKSLWEKAQGIYHYVLGHMVYDKTTPGWGEGNTIRACLLGKGNCTDFHSLFISIAHASEIPSRFKIGFTIPREGEGKIPGYHCWAEFFDETKGWVQVDASEAWKHPEMKKHYFGRFDTNKFFLSLGRDLQLVPRQAGEPINIFIYPYLEADGRPLEGKVQTEFSFRNFQP